jgi:hypothetical protein
VPNEEDCVGTCYCVTQTLCQAAEFVGAALFPFYTSWACVDLTVAELFSGYGIDHRVGLPEIVALTWERRGPWSGCQHLANPCDGGPGGSGAVGVDRHVLGGWLRSLGVSPSSSWRRVLLWLWLWLLWLGCGSVLGLGSTGEVKSLLGFATSFGSCCFGLFACRGSGGPGGL